MATFAVRIFKRYASFGVTGSTAALLSLGLIATPALAKVSQAEADKLKSELTPVGAERAANSAGTIPKWEGGLKTAPPCYKGRGTRYCDPFPSDKPLFTITKANLATYKGQLTEGQKALFAKFGDSYKMNVYPTRRTVGFPDFVYEATTKNALNAELTNGGESLNGAVLGIPFPIPKTGNEPIWNHKLRYRGVGVDRWNNQAAVTTSGDFNLVKIHEQVKFLYDTRGITPEQLDNVGIYFMQVVTAPPRLAGQITLVHETMDQVKEPRRAWQYNPGQRRLRRAPNVGYDNPGTGADGLRTNDQTDTFNGATDRYTWKLVGKKEMYIPYNAYVVHSDKYKFKDIIRKGHINQDLPRYELHRVWVVESNIKPGTTHIYRKRVFYVDEDSWQIAAVDIYDARQTLWRVQESHLIGIYDLLGSGPVLETVYDLQSGRYLAQAMNNEDPETSEKNFEVNFFDPANVAKQASK
ncbi:DUF1329 domain-containing protein [Stenotrophobium rhamnosiphilum]|uniref:DUF1329 domain-containing protein n=1 Tax=Stenotrophobium rhamnosiphilum TaxID=2029166 RepID=A0A2T5MDU2_9GAMM|nr:DUF1329 domain-containing protein [Stenotrophobium rhamnosiphilum]PTU30717.1 DUF1329 domain-containing protein [Stenotrophobium rhamnosiphilum]